VFDYDVLTRAKLHNGREALLSASLSLSLSITAQRGRVCGKLRIGAPPTLELQPAAFNWHPALQKAQKVALPARRQIS